MGRPKKNPGVAGPATDTVRISRLLAAKARVVVSSLHRTGTLADYLDGILREAIERDYAEWDRVHKAEVARLDADNPKWREELEAYEKANPKWVDEVQAFIDGKKAEKLATVREAPKPPPARPPGKKAGKPKATAGS